MYYVTNPKDQIIAIDEALLKLLGFDTIDNLQKKIAREEVTFDSSIPNELTISMDTEQYSYAHIVIALSSMFGDLSLHIIQNMESESSPSDDLTQESISILGEEETESKEAPIPLDEEPLSVIEETSEEVAVTEGEGIPTFEEPEESEEETSVEDTLSVKETGLTPIVIDIEKVSRTIGVSPEDYVLFLNQFIDEAISLEKDLQSIDLQKQSDAIHTLKHLGSVLHLSEVTEVIEKIEQSTSEEKVEQIEILYSTLARLTTYSTESDLLTPESDIEAVEEKDSLISLGEDKIEPEVSVKKQEPEGQKEVEGELLEKHFGSLTMEELDEVKPIHFDFRLEEAADELSLPVKLIEEFISDFLLQAREETVNMLSAYRTGDLDRVQKIGHLLKGAASNLRINPLADTLYEIQFCEDLSLLEDLIKKYWAHFISFEKQMKMTLT